MDRPIALISRLWHWSEKESASPKYTAYMFRELLWEHLDQYCLTNQTLYRKTILGKD